MEDPLKAYNDVLKITGESLGYERFNYTGAQIDDASRKYNTSGIAGRKSIIDLAGLGDAGLYDDNSAQGWTQLTHEQKKKIIQAYIDKGEITDGVTEWNEISKMYESHANEFGDLDILQISDNITPKEQDVDYLRDLGISDKTLREIGLLKRKQIDRGESYATEDDYQYDYDELTSLAQDKLDDGGVSQDEWDGSSEEEKKDIENQVKDGDY